MLSSWSIWDYFKSHFKNLKSHNSLHSFFIPDPFVGNIFYKKITAEENFRILSGSEITNVWIEENLCSLSLFGNSDYFLINHAELISKNSLEEILQRASEFSERLVVLIFTKDVPLRKKIMELEGTHISIEPPKFWEMDKLLEFFSDQLGVRLGFEAKQYILEAIPQESSSIYTALSMLKLNYPNQSEISITQTEAVLTETKLDQFLLANFYSRKEKIKFYEKLLSIEFEFDKFRSFFSFMQGHLMKLADPTLLNKKPRLTKYDKDILANSKLWKLTELKNEIRFFSELEILSKKKSSFLQPKLQSYYFSLIYQN